MSQRSENKKQRSFLDYYQNERIIPVAQKIDDLKIHFARREALYRSCGIPSGWVAGKQVLEVGPGTGHNALFTYSLNPKRYVLLDGHSLSIEATDQNLRETFGSHHAELVEADFVDYQSDEQFDLVLCEGTIPFQSEPNQFAQKLGCFVAPGGILLVTTVSASSFLSELLRRILGGMLIEEAGLKAASTQEKLEVLLPFFANHLKHLKGMTRSHQDWILDNILFPYVGEVWSIRDAVESLSEDFVPYHASPNFITDWRWYKEIDLDHKAETQRVVRCYEEQLLNFLDYRAVYPVIPQAVGHEIEALCLAVYRLSQNNFSHDWRKDNQLAIILEQIIELLSGLEGTVSIQRSLLAMQQALLAYQAQQADWQQSLRPFENWFGRGMSYLSFQKQA